MIKFLMISEGGSEELIATTKEEAIEEMDRVFPDWREEGTTKGLYLDMNPEMTDEQMYLAGQSEVAEGRLLTYDPEFGMWGAA